MAGVQDQQSDQEQNHISVIITIPAFMFREPKNTGVQRVLSAICSDQKETANLFSGRAATLEPANANAK